MLEKIIDKTYERIKNIKNLSKLRSSHNIVPLTPPLFIAEIKRKSPSRGLLSNNLNLLKKVEDYINGGANLISVVTEPYFFGGDIKDIEIIKNNFNIGVLRKDFIISKEQIVESKNAGADAILLIASILNYRKIKEFIHFSKNLGLLTLVECHSEYDIEKSLQAGAEIIGINSRDLNTLKIDLSLFSKLRPYIPDEVVKIAESGIHNFETIKKIKSLGYDGFLVGTKLMLEKNSDKILKEWIKEWKK